MINRHIKHFGKAVSLIVYIPVVLIAFAGINLSNFKSLGNVSVPYFIAFLLAFFVSVFLFYTKQKTIFNILIIVVILLSQAYIISSLHRSVELSQGYEDFQEQRDALGLVWIIAIPIGLIVVFIIGLVFDLVKNKVLSKRPK